MQEVECLERLGQELRRLRKLTDLTLAEYAWEVELSPTSVGRLERGVRRTRRSTLARIAAVAAAECPDEGTADEILAQMILLGGAAIADESEYKARTDRRRARRRRKAAKIKFAHWQDDPDEDDATALRVEEPTEAPWWLPVVDPEAAANNGFTWLDLVEEGAE
jgi:transcriptional regulator with XRE-family HTH domain